MGITYDCRCQELCRCFNRLPSFTKDPGAAWLVIEKLLDKFHAVVKTPFETGGDFIVGFTPLGMSGWNGRPDFMGTAKTMALAACLAALDAVDGKMARHSSNKR